jgi:cell division protein FtsQ
MRRLNNITIQVEDRFGPGRASARDATANRSAGRPGSRQQIRRRPFWRKRTKRLSLAVILVAGVVGLPAWLILTGTGARLADTAREHAIALSLRAGFRVEEIYVEGRKRTAREDLLTALNVHRGDPILGIDLSATRQRLEEIAWVKTATLERRLPNEVHLLITEREPVALWQNQGKYYLVDGEGLVVSDQVDDYPDLPLIVGEGAPDHAAALLDMLKTEPDLQSRIKAAQWVSGRRWNLTFDRTTGGIDVRLPEENPETALHDLGKLEREQKLLERKITLIDMRLPDRLVLRTTGGAEESANAAAAERAKHKAQPGKDA